MKLQPLNKRIVVKTIDEEMVTPSGIVKSTEKARGKQQVGIVVAVDESGIQMAGLESTVKVGDKVLFQKYAGTEYKDEDSGDDLLIVELTDLLAIVKS